MALLTGPRNTPAMGDLWSEIPIGVEASTSIYLGAMVAIDVNGYAVPAQPYGASPLTQLVVLGRAEKVQGAEFGENALNTAGSGVLALDPYILGDAGALILVVRRGVFGYDNDSTIAQPQIGQICYALDDHTVSVSDGSGANPISEEAHTIPASGPLVVQVSNHGACVAGSFVVQNSGNSTTYVLGTDYYIIDSANGIIGFMGATLVAGTVVHISYKYGAAANPVAGRVLSLENNLVFVDFNSKSPLAV